MGRTEGVEVYSGGIRLRRRERTSESCLVHQPPRYV